MVTRTRKDNRSSRIWAVACIALSFGLMFPAYGGFGKGQGHGKKRDGVAPSATKISPVLRDEVEFQ